MTAYFADTSFWIAMSRQRDQYHSSAAAWYRFIRLTNAAMVTTEAVLWEWLNALSGSATRRVAAKGYKRVHEDPHIEVVPFDPELVAAATTLYKERRDKDWSLTDCLSFVVMHRRSLSDALTTDHHFEQANLKAKMLELPVV